MLNPQDEALNQRQREAIMRKLPATVGQLAKALRWPESLIRKRLQVLYKQQAAQVVGQAHGKVQIWGYYNGVPYVHQPKFKVIPPPAAIPPSPFKTRWIGGVYPGVY